MPVTEGEDGKLYYKNENKLKYSDYMDWFDNGPGSERHKREIRESMKAQAKPPNVKGFPWYAKSLAKSGWNLRGLSFQEVLSPKEYITDEDIKIDV